VGINIAGSNASNNQIGYHPQATIPLDLEKANIIAYNDLEGIVISNEFPEDVNPVENTIRGNHIYENGALGIDLLYDYGETLNDVDDADDGANHLMNYPDVNRVAYNGGFNVVAVEYVISSDDTIVSYPLTVDVYLADDASSGEGKTFIGSQTYLTPNDLALFDIDATSFSWDPTDVLVLTTTDADGNTSEFSPPSEEIGGPGNVFAGQRDVLQIENPRTFYLSAAYPNPFNPQTTVTLNLPVPTELALTVHDVTGRQVATLHSGFLSAEATHTFTFDATGFASGVYYLRASSASFTASRRLVLVK
jgi:hypothetical protein